MFQKIKDKIRSEIKKDVHTIIKIAIIVGSITLFLFLTIITLLILILIKLY